jgi:hypothetical protein
MPRASHTSCHRGSSPLAAPSFAPGVMEALQVSIERYTREAMRGVQGSIPCGAIKFCKCRCSESKASKTL